MLRVLFVCVSLSLFFVGQRLGVKKKKTSVALTSKVAL